MEIPKLIIILAIHLFSKSGWQRIIWCLWESVILTFIEQSQWHKT